MIVRPIHKKMSFTPQANDSHRKTLEDRIDPKKVKEGVFDEKVFSKNDMKHLVYLFVRSGCNNKMRELQIAKYDNLRLQNRDTRFSNELQGIFDSVCLGEYLFRSYWF